MTAPLNSTECKTFWAEFLLLYKAMPALWNTKSAEYRDRKLKTHCYKHLVAKLREIAPNADRHTVVRKINVFRNGFRREQKKVLNTQESDKPHVPNLWYFELLTFLNSELHMESDRGSDSYLDGDGDQSDGLDTFHFSDECEEKELQVADGEDSSLIDFESSRQFETEFKAVSIADVEYVELSQDELEDPECVFLDEDNKGESQCQEDIQFEPTSDDFATKSPTKKRAHQQLNDQYTAKKKTRLEQTGHIQIERVDNYFRDDHDENYEDDRNYEDDEVTTVPRQQNDVSKILALSWAVQHNEMNPKQKIIARQLISHILYLGCIGQLSVFLVRRLQKLLQNYTPSKGTNSS